MREIKFRAWDVESNEMTLPNDILEVLVSMKNEVYAMVKGRNETLGGINRDNTILMQYTGLKDVKGVDIYENDIVIFDDSERSYHGVVKAGGWYLYLDLYEAYDVVNFDAFSDENDMTADVQVIGNIYENHELLGNSQ